MELNEVKELIKVRLEQLSEKNKHYIVDMGSIEEPKEEKLYHKSGKGERWCSSCERINELKKLLKNINIHERKLV